MSKTTKQALSVKMNTLECPLTGAILTDATISEGMILKLLVKAKKGDAKARAALKKHNNLTVKDIESINSIEDLRKVKG